MASRVRASSAVNLVWDRELYMDKAKPYPLLALMEVEQAALESFRYRSGIRLMHFDTLAQWSRRDYRRPSHLPLPA